MRSPRSEPYILVRMACMNAALIFLDPGSPLSLQNQIREKLVELLEMLDTFPLQFAVVEPRPLR